MENIIEEQRRNHEERERLMSGMTREMVRKKQSHCEQINSDHVVRVLLDKYVSSTSNLIDLYEDDAQRKKEIQSLSGPNEFNEFYTRLKTVLQYHRKGSNAPTDSNIYIPMSVEIDNLLNLAQKNDDDLNLVNFTDEEGYGKYLDLNECHQKYINLKSVERVDYLKYLSIYNQMHLIPKEKKNQEYKRYVESLYDYLYDYIQRVKPLYDVESEMRNIESDFEVKWNEGTFQGWPKETSGALAKSGAYLDLSGYSSWQELASLGLDRLKSALMALGLKCGGTLEERAKRLFETKGKRLQDLDPGLFSKPQNSSKKSLKEFTDKHKEIALIEAKIYKFSDVLTEEKTNTIENVQRKQARTGDERLDDEEDHVSVEDSDTDDEIIYNPKNLPLGWDGKPIPYWLYKLHGLNLYYNCEICGNHKYRGPKAFQKHFSEWRHAHGMRCLGIPNTAHFANITLIKDAIMLWEKLKVSREQERWRPENEEEYEDTNGNVFNKKTHDDLKRQGLL